jgi:hypothetical protein
MRHKRRLIAQAFLNLDCGAIFRLYVDGDLANMRDLQFWFGLLNRRPDVQCFGYSKSWKLLVKWQDSGLPFPRNYVLNQSSGSKYEDDDDLFERVASLPITRGQFVAVCVPGHGRGKARYDDAQYHADVRNAARSITGIAKVFSCPDDCGKCTKHGPMCGLATARGVVVAIGKH